MSDNDDLVDIDQARILLSLKHDEINSLKISMKTLEKRTSIKVAELQYKIDQEKSKVVDSERKFTRMQETLNKEKAAHEQTIASLHADVHKLKELNAELHAEERKKERELRAAIYDERLQTERQKDINLKLQAELQALMKIIDPKKILAALGKTTLEELPSYLEIYSKKLQKEEQVKQLNLHMERLRSQTIANMEQSFSKLTSYQAVMQDLKSRNQVLQESIYEKQAELEAHSSEIVEQKQLLQTVELEVSEQIGQLNDEIVTLRTYVQTYEQGEQDLQVIQREHRNNTEIISDLQSRLQARQNELQQYTLDTDEKLAQLLEQNTLLRKELEQISKTHRQELEYCKILIERLQRNIAEKQEIIGLMNNSIRDQETYSEEKQVELEKYVQEFNELLKKKRREEEEFRENQEIYQMQLNGLAEEVQYLRAQLGGEPQNECSINEFANVREGSIESYQEPRERGLTRVRSGMESVVSGPRNLMADIRLQSQLGDKMSKFDIGHYQPEQNWSQLYYSLLQKHNEFCKKLYGKIYQLSRRNR